MDPNHFYVSSGLFKWVEFASGALAVTEECKCAPNLITKFFKLILT